MLYGLISDVHGNIDALEVALAHLERLEVDRIAFLGDAVGYGANPNEACDRIREVADFAVLGNHDAAVAGRMGYDEYYDAARHALDWCVEVITPENMAWLKGLPYKECEGHIEFCHGAPVEPEVFDYLFSAEQAMGVLRGAFDSLAEVTFIGHSHLTIAFEIRGNSVAPIIEKELQCDDSLKYVITAGSVGQPRDRDPRMCCGTYDSETRLFQYHRLEYDILSQRRKILEAGIATVFGDRLLVGI